MATSSTRNGRTTVRQPSDPHGYGRRPKDGAHSSLRVAVYGAIGGGVALIGGEMLSFAMFPRSTMARTAFLAIVGIGLSILVGAIGDPVLTSVRKVERRLLRRWIS